MKNMTEALLEAWTVHNSINLALMGKIPAAGFRAVPYGSRGRTVAEQLLHMNRVRLGWLHYHRTGKRPERSREDATGLTRSHIRKSLSESCRQVQAFLLDAFREAATTRAFAHNSVLWMAYLISHESHHRGQILLALKQNGMRMPDRVALHDVWGRWMWGK